jgi:two-component system, LuxR family, response regulator FixJ
MMNGDEQATIHIVARELGARRALTQVVADSGRLAVHYDRFPEDPAALVADEPGCLLLDTPRCETNRLELQQLTRSPALLPVIVISPPVDVSIAVDVMKDGAFHFMERPFRASELLHWIDAALAKDAANRQGITDHAELRRRAASLTPRERQVMALVAGGKVSKVIAVDLGLSDRTVGIDRANVMDKMRAVSIAHLVRMHLLLVRATQHQHFPATRWSVGSPVMAETAW